MSASAQTFNPSLSKSSTGLTSASESRSERAHPPVFEESEPSFVDKLKGRMQTRPRSRSDSYSSTATTLNQCDVQCEATAMRQSQQISTDVLRQERKKANRRSSEMKPPMKRASRSTFSDVGRHSNDWLFGGFSVKDTARGLLKRRDS